MKIVVVSDIHSNDVAFEAVLEDMPDTEHLLCAGDVVGYNTRPNRVVELVREHTVECVMGNHDAGIAGRRRMAGKPLRAMRWNKDELTAENREFVENLPDEYRETLDGVAIYMTHGSPRDNHGEYVYRPGYSLLQFFEDEPDLIILGHTHVPMVEQVNDTVVLNPGSVGQPRDGDERASYAVVDLDTLDVDIRRVRYDIDRVAEEVAEEIADQYGQRLYLGK